jgi:hypothetical protein
LSTFKGTRLDGGATTLATPFVRPRITAVEAAIRLTTALGIESLINFMAVAQREFGSAVGSSPRKR